MDYEILKQKVETYQTLLKHYVNTDETRKDFCNLEHVVNNQLTTLISVLEFMEIERSTEPLKNFQAEVKNTLKNLEYYFNLLDEKPSFLEMELTNGYYPEKKKQLNSNDYIKYLRTNLGN